MGSEQDQLFPFIKWLNLIQRDSFIERYIERVVKDVPKTFCMYRKPARIGETLDLVPKSRIGTNVFEGCLKVHKVLKHLLRKRMIGSVRQILLKKAEAG